MMQIIETTKAVRTSVDRRITLIIGNVIGSAFHHLNRKQQRVRDKRTKIQYHLAKSDALFIDYKEP